MSDVNHGAGGSYVIDEDSGRVLVERTKEEHAAKPALLPVPMETQTQAQARNKKLST